MLGIFVGHCHDRGLDARLVVMSAIKCSERTARNKIRGVTEFTVSEALSCVDYIGLNPVGLDFKALFSNSSDGAS